jgi:hypothetical protein
MVKVLITISCIVLIPILPVAHVHSENISLGIDFGGSNAINDYGGFLNSAYGMEQVSFIH